MKNYTDDANSWIANNLEHTDKLTRYSSHLKHAMEYDNGLYTTESAFDKALIGAGFKVSKQGKCNAKINPENFKRIQSHRVCQWWTPNRKYV